METVEGEECPDLADVQEQTWQNLRPFGSGGGEGDGGLGWILRPVPWHAGEQ